jgi:hypothetical protein
MADAPLYSEDGHWWWDEGAQQWQPVQGQASVATADSGDGDRAAARVAAGLPASLDELTSEHHAQYLDEPTVYAEPLVFATVPVLEMTDEEESA